MDKRNNSQQLKHSNPNLHNADRNIQTDSATGIDGEAMFL